MRAVTLLLPPYLVETAANGDPPFGAIALARVESAADALTELHAYLESFPWCAPCVVVSTSDVSAETLQAIWSLPGQPGFIIGGRGQPNVGPSAVAAAVTRRPRPRVPHLVGYVMNRTLSASLGQTLEQIWGPARGPSPLSADRTIRYRLRRSGRFSRLDWLRVLRLINGKSLDRGQTVDRFAEELGSEARTVRAWTAQCLDTPLRVYRERVGWEWVLEAALRMAGLVDPAPALGAAS